MEQLAAGYTLDAGVLIAADKNDPAVWRLAKALTSFGLTLTVPAGVLAQTWRGPRSSRIASFLGACVVEPLDENRAKSAGELCALAGTSDVVDASVVAGAHKRWDCVITTDVDDLRLLASYRPGATIVHLRDLL